MLPIIDHYNERFIAEKSIYRLQLKRGCINLVDVDNDLVQEKLSIAHLEGYVDALIEDEQTCR